MYICLLLQLAFAFCEATNAIRASVDNDFGRSSGKPKARDQIICARIPSARETPNKTV